jgi:hypothetical protein
MSSSDGSNTKVGLGTWFQGGILLAAVAGTVTVVTMASDLRHGLDMLTVRADQTQASVSKIENAVETLKYGLWEAGTDRWTGSDMRNWAFELQRANPTVAVPKVAHDLGRDATPPASGR